MRFRPKRYATDVFVTLRYGAVTKRAQLRDVSPHGARINCAALAPVGTQITVEHLGTKLPARVCWLRDTTHGVVFSPALGSVKLAAMRGVHAQH